MLQNTYTVWSWYETPMSVTTHSDKCTWVVRVDPGYGFPYKNLRLHTNPDWEVNQKKIDGSWYMFIKDPNNIVWPRFEPNESMFLTSY